jgi:hypothetical protein
LICRHCRHLERAQPEVATGHRLHLLHH